MATAAKKSRSTRNTRNTATSGRRGRPSNADRNAAQASQTAHLIDLGIAAASAAIKATLGLDASAGTVSTVGIPQGSQSQSAGTSTGSQSQTTSTSRGRKSPGRRIDPKSNMSLTREFYAEQAKLPSDQRMSRADFVRAAAKKFGCSTQTANTYVSNIERESGKKLLARRGTGAARGRSRGNGNGNSQRNGTNG